MTRQQRVAQFFFMASCLFTIVSCCFPFTQVHIVKGTLDTTELTRVITTVGFCWIIIAAVLGIIITLFYYKRAFVLAIGIIIMCGSLILLMYGPRQKKEYMSQKKTYNTMSALLVRPVETEPTIDFEYKAGYYLAPAFGATALASAVICFISVKDEEGDQ